MDQLYLYIANKNYSSWSFRPWIAMKTIGLDFKEILVPFGETIGQSGFEAFSPTARVPVLKHGNLVVWESTAILDYVDELDKAAGLWPDDRAERATARSLCAEMHAGFSALRATCPMNMRRVPGKIDLSDAVNADIARVETIFSECLEQSGGPFLFGRFGAVDAMFAPVVNRFEVYCLSRHPTVMTYMDTIKALPAYREWEQAGKAEPWIVPEDEA